MGYGADVWLLKQLWSSFCCIFSYNNFAEIALDFFESSGSWRLFSLIVMVVSACIISLLNNWADENLDQYAHYYNVSFYHFDRCFHTSSNVASQATWVVSTIIGQYQS